MTNWQKEQFLLEEQFVKRLLIDYGIREVTTQKQAKNETREFEFPVPAYTKQRLKWFEEKKVVLGGKIYHDYALLASNQVMYVSKMVQTEHIN